MYSKDQPYSLHHFSNIAVIIKLLICRLYIFKLQAPSAVTYSSFKKYAELFNFLLVYMHNELISQHNCRRDRCTSVSGVSIPLCHS